MTDTSHDRESTPITVEGLIEFFGALFIFAAFAAGIAFVVGMSLGFGFHVYMKLIGY